MTMNTYSTKYGNFTCYKNDAVFESMLKNGQIYEENLIVDYIIPVLKKNDEEINILDIGGHIGTHTVLYSKLLNCKILTFEPQKKIYKLLNKNVNDNGLLNCKLYNCAVGHKILNTTMSEMLYDGYNCKVEYDTDKILNYGGIGLGKNGESVDMISIDSLNLTKCDYIKIDVEGAEILVLMGANETIQKFKPLIWFEQTDKTVSEEMKESLLIDFEMPSVSDYLAKLGYRFYKLNDGNTLAFFDDKHKLEIDLSHKERTVHSESGEDGILFEIFNVFGTTNRFYLEFGAENGTQCNTRALRECANFNGILFDMNCENKHINLFKHTVTTENVIELFEFYNVPKNLDLLSVDIDSHDFYVLEKILMKYKPRVFVCEYNATHLPNEDKVVLKNATNFNGNYFGASILAFYNLGKKYNYSLVYANEKGVNLFFINNDVLTESFFTIKNINDVEKIYKTPKYGKGPNGGHMPDILNQEYISSVEILHR